MNFNTNTNTTANTTNDYAYDADYIVYILDDVVVYMEVDSIVLDLGV